MTSLRTYAWEASIYTGGKLDKVHLSGNNVLSSNSERLSDTSSNPYISSDPLNCLFD